MALKTTNKSRKKEKVVFPDPFLSSAFKKEEVVIEEPDAVIINYIVTEEDLELYKALEHRQEDDISIVIFWISIIVVSAIGLLL
jgi:hypothetical protein